MITKATLLLMVLLFAWSDELALRPGVEFRPWQVITYAFAHGSVWHLLLNGLALATFGSSVERIAGSRNFACILLVGILAGAITLMETPMAGMSAGIFAVITFYCLHKPRAKVYLLIVPMEALTLMIVCAAVSVTLAAFGDISHIAHLAHAMGMAGGALCWLVWERKQ